VDQRGKGELWDKDSSGKGGEGVESVAAGEIKTGGLGQEKKKKEQQAQEKKGGGEKRFDERYSKGMSLKVAGGPRRRGERKLVGVPGRGGEGGEKRGKAHHQNWNAKTGLKLGGSGVAGEKKGRGGQN